MGRWWVCFCGILMATAQSLNASEPITVYAAASLGSAVRELVPLAQKRGLPLRLSFGSSSILAKQIARGAPADLYMSANVQWMDFLAERECIEAETRQNLLANTLVVIAPRGETFRITPQPDFNFAKTFSGRLAMGDPSHVPAGKYARQALEHLGWWEALKNRIAPAMDVRGALALVERGECPVGIVYATDAAISTGITIIATLPDSLHIPIQYPMAVVKGRLSDRTKTALRFFLSDEAAAVFRRYGFVVLNETPEM